jgi:hypothetical protein
MPGAAAPGAGAMLARAAVGSTQPAFENMDGDELDVRRPRSLPRSTAFNVVQSGGAGSRTHVKGPNRNERRRGLTHQTHEIVWTSRSRSIPRRPVPSRP